MNEKIRLDELVADAMKDENIIIEVKDEKGKWTKAGELLEEDN